MLWEGGMVFSVGNSVCVVGVWEALCGERVEGVRSEEKVGVACGRKEREM